MFFGGSFQCSPISADSCPPDVSACAWMVGSHSYSPKLSPLFRSDDHAKQLSPARRVRSSFVAAAFRPASLVFQVPHSLCLMQPSGARSSCCKISRMNTCAKTVGGVPPVQGIWITRQIQSESGRARDATAGNAKASYDSRKPMRSLTARAVFYSLLIVGAIGWTSAALAPGASAFAPSASAFAKDKPLVFKSIESALLRVNDAPPKDWGVYRTGKKNDPLLLQIRNRFLLLEINQHQVFEIDPAKIERKAGELLWSLSDRPDKPLATSDWTVDDIGAAFIVKVRLQRENALVDLQLPHPPNVGDLPDRPPAQ